MFQFYFQTHLLSLLAAIFNFGRLVVVVVVIDVDVVCCFFLFYEIKIQIKFFFSLS